MVREAAPSSAPGPLNVPPAPSPNAPATTTLILVVVVAALYLGQDILVPLALSILLSFALAPLVIRLRRWGVGRVPSVLLVVAFVFLLVTVFGTVVVNQMSGLAENLSRYELNIRAKIRSVGELTTEGGVVSRVKEALSGIQQEIQDATNGPSGEARAVPGSPAAEDDEQTPIPVEIRDPPARPIEIMSDFAGGILTPMATAGIIIVFVIFLLLQREDLRDRFIRLFGSRDVHRTTEAMTDAAQRVSRYLLMQLCINTFYGMTIGIGLYLIGVPHPLLWGLLGAVLRFIPYVGPVLAAGAPIAVALAVDPGWTMPLLAVSVFVMLELFINNVLEPWLYGSSTGLSPVAILTAAVFWTTLWGPVGLLLSTPLTVCLVVLGRHVPQLQFLEVLLGSEPVLSVEIKLYQRLLASDPDEAIDVVDEFLEDKPVPELYDKVLIPALAFADQDRLRGVIDRERWTALAEHVLDIIDDVKARDAGADAPAEAARQEGAASNPDSRPAILCIGPRNRLDEVAAVMLADLLTKSGFEARVLPGTTLTGGSLEPIARNGVAAVCLSYVQPEALHHARRSVRSLRRQCPAGVPIVLGLWNAQPRAEGPRDLCALTGADRLVVSLTGAVREVHELTQAAASKAAAATAGS
jgi:predicted PurR-regulated permease PerM